MGASSSTGNPSPEAHDQESLASAALALSLLHAAHSRSAMSAASANALPDALTPPSASFRLSRSSPPAHLDVLLVRLGPVVASHFFGHREGADAGWLGFLKGSTDAARVRRRHSRSRCSSACTPWPASTPGRPAACSSSRATAVTTPWPNRRRGGSGRRHPWPNRHRPPRCLLLLDSIDLFFAGASKSPPFSPSLSSLRAPRVEHESRLARMREGERIRGYAGCRREREFYGGGCGSRWRIYSSYAHTLFPSAGREAGSLGLM